MNSPTNVDRANWARIAAQAFAEETSMDAAGEELDTVLGDMLANVMHLCDQEGLDFDCLLARARMHHSEETRF